MSETFRTFDESYPPELWEGGGGPQLPTLISIAPTSVPPTGAGFPLVATGTNFQTGDFLTIDGMAQSSVVDSPTQITAAVATAPTTPGDYPVVVNRGVYTTAPVMLTVTATGGTASRAELIEAIEAEVEDVVEAVDALERAEGLE